MSKIMDMQYSAPEMKVIALDVEDIMLISNTDNYDNGLDDIEWDFSNLGGGGL